VCGECVVSVWWAIWQLMSEGELLLVLRPPKSNTARAARRGMHTRYWGRENARVQKRTVAEYTVLGTRPVEVHQVGSVHLVVVHAPLPLAGHSLTE
jgi:hypothetical protein